MNLTTNYQPISNISSVTMPSTKDPKWTIVYTNGAVLVTTNPVTMLYRPKTASLAADEPEME